ncbi:high affinity cAMP-specific and IBMX-insensitive 3',5'-cyclic phosphodiesterase 8B-like isoform X2 [Babylonia areolata]|uniref:high affinity cAMP-specific and IBMX-insensitive 3',5'-cyclic phosphodiesterase 8B-like isoform X2 n=1 Tax=Babylonia areolata TaxID=304850 RepID=UPI003FD13643
MAALAGGERARRDSSGVDAIIRPGPVYNGMVEDTFEDDADVKGTEEDIYFGSMRISQKPVSVLLVFGKTDAQSEVLWQAADKLGFSRNLVHTAESALETFLQRLHDVVIIDHRSARGFDADTLCRSLRASVKNNDYTVMVAVCKQIQSDKEEPSILPLLKAGFHKRITENTNLGCCVNELHQLAYGEVRTQRKLRACGALVTALDNISDAVEITNEEHTIQYVNPMHERVTGFSNDELVGQGWDLCDSERNKDTIDTVTAQTKTGKYWEGTCYTRQKTGDSIPFHCRVIPVLGPGGKVHQYVSVKSITAETQIANGGVHGIPRRRESITRATHSTTIEAPITKVISMITAAQESSSLTVAQALEKVVEILQTSELYAPLLPMLASEKDPMTTDLVGGLVSQNVARRNSAHDIQTHKSLQPHLHQHVSGLPASLSQIPKELQDILDSEPSWDFDVIQLEEATHKRPLMYLGLKTFVRFEVCQFLGIEEGVVVQWLHTIEDNYHSANHYHNSTHAADVLHASAYFLECDTTKTVFEPMDRVASLIAATVHDVDHPGRTNAFLVNEGNPLALLYNDLAVLESHHASLAFRLTHKDDSVNIFQNLSREDYFSLRVSIVDMVLATEMKQHFEHLNKFVNSVNKSVLKYDTEGSGAETSTSVSPDRIKHLSTPEHRTLIKRMLIKCADVSNPVRPWKLCKAWAERIAEEYCSQTDEEKQRGLPVVMPVFDRKTCSIPKSQTAFIDVFINNMFDAWDYYCDIPDLMNYLQTNYQRWKELGEDSTPSPGPVSTS